MSNMQLAIDYNKLGRMTTEEQPQSHKEHKENEFCILINKNDGQWSVVC